LTIYVPAHVAAELQGQDGYQRKHGSSQSAFNRLRAAARKRRLRSLHNTASFQDKLRAELIQK